MSQARLGAYDPPVSSDAQTAIFFPLRSSVELFDDPRSPTAVVRAKDAACLYDRVIFESGLLDVTIASNGSMPWWYPKEI
ncbi:MAG TPA: hypothetical protein VHF51_05495 [Solirubrobacteraceae bacterium]|nr:hypothetical protein [Solirubrobacteraceae bacterium]